FSFHAVKNLTTGEGGAVALNIEGFDNEAIYKELNVRSLHGQSKDALSKNQIGGWRYDVKMLGAKCNMTDIQAAMGLVELNRYRENLNRREAIFDKYSEAFKDDERFIIPEYKTEVKKSAFHLYLLRLAGHKGSQRDEVIQEISNEQVGVNVHYIPLPGLTYFKGLGYRSADFPVAFDSSEREITLPVYYDLTDEQVDKVIGTVKKVLDAVPAT
ncbi:MAG: DegT/DnrJ/EryC1/StrS family aminotransferase, partial [Flavobacteriales bacterium]